MTRSSDAVTNKNTKIRRKTENNSLRHIMYLRVCIYVVTWCLIKKDNEKNNGSLKAIICISASAFGFLFFFFTYTHTYISVIVHH